MWSVHHGFWFCPFGLLFFLLVIVFIVSRMFWFRRFGDCRRQWQDEADEILRKRLANGEISESDYQHLKDILKK